MTNKAPGRSHRHHISVFNLQDMFPDEKTAVKWVEDQRWPSGSRCCPRCKGTKIREVPNAKPMPYWCKPCRKYFSVKVGTVMESSPLPVRTWVFGIYLMTTNLKGVSSMKLHNDLKITQRTAWYMAHRIRESLIDDGVPLQGEIEADETFIGGREQNKHGRKKLRAGRGTVGKVAVVGVKERGGRVKAMPVGNTDKETLQGFIRSSVDSGSTVYTDDHGGYDGLRTAYKHRKVRHSVGEYVKRQAHTNSIESFWSMLKRGHKGTYHKMSPKHLHRYVDEFAGRHNIRDLDTMMQMAYIILAMVGRRLKYKALTAKCVREL